MDRRKFLSISSSTAVAAGLGLVPNVEARNIAPGAALPADASGRLGWDEFIEQTIAATSTLVTDRSQSGQDAYLYTMAALASRLGELPAVELRDFGGLDPAYELDLIFRREGAPFIILYWKMEPNAVLPAHCHPGANVCTLCTRGDVILRNYDTAPGSPECWSGSADEFEVIETNTELLRAGAVNIVSEFRNNIHRFEAGPAGAEGIDITTGYDESPKPFSFLRLWQPGKSVSGASTYRGQWVGKDIQRAV
ncbi:MAG: hypothetical protein R3192_15960 [Woeseiaceae bacterium]|nr:hypothetical protein [Woeseiaceae bacterium]